MNADEERTAVLVALAGLDGLGPSALLACHGADDLSGLWCSVVAGRVRSVPELGGCLVRDPAGSAQRLARGAREVDPGQELARHLAGDRQVVVLGGPGYPDRLAEDPAPPALLFVEGDLGCLAGPTVAIVGTRNATRAGRGLASSWAGALARRGVSVVSGLALGIDGAAHQGVLGSRREDSGERTVGRGDPVGVVASGLDIAYPASHARLHREVAGTGLLVSETPLGRRPLPWRFPARNRIIAGLADAVVVVESRSKGGSILTAGEAVARDVPVLAVPGHPTAPAAAGTNDLLADGALVARDVEDVLVAIGLGGQAELPARDGTAVPVLGPHAAAVVGALGPDPLSLDEILVRTGLGLPEASVALAELDEAGTVVRTGSWYEVAAAPGGGRSGLAGWDR